MKFEKAIDEIARRGTKAWGELKKTRDFNHWWTVGEALQALQQEAMNEAGIPLRSNSRPAGIIYSRAIGELLKKYKLDDMDKGDRSRLLQMMEYRSEITEWHTRLPPALRTRYTHPTTVWRHWQASIAPPKPACEPKMTNLKQTEDALITAHEELHQARLHIAELEAARSSLPTLEGERQRDPDLAAKLEPLLEGLFVEGQKNMSTMVPAEVARLAILLERLLVANGIILQSRRSENPIAYAKAMKGRAGLKE
jgi:hypothetical protein